MIKPHIIFPRKNITNLTFETIAHNINALAGDVLGDVLVISGDVLVSEHELHELNGLWAARCFVFEHELNE